MATKIKRLRYYLTNKMTLYIMLFIAFTGVIIFVSFDSYQHIKLLIDKINPINYQLNFIEQKVTQNGVFVQTWIQTNDDKIKHKISSLINAEIPADIEKLDILYKKANIKFSKSQLEVLFKHYRWSLWRTMDLAEQSSEQLYNSTSYKRSNELYRKITENWQYSFISKKSSKINRNLYLIIFKVNTELNKFLTINRQYSANNLQRYLDELSLYNANLVVDDEVSKSLKDLLSKYISNAKSLLNTHPGNKKSLMKNQLEKRFIPNQEALRDAISMKINYNLEKIKKSQNKIQLLSFIMMFCLLLLLFASVILGLKFIRQIEEYIIGPIEKITKGMLAIARGDFRLKLESSKIFEINRLTITFSKMLEQRKSYEDKLKEEKDEVVYMAIHDSSLDVYNFQYFIKDLGKTILLLTKENYLKKVLIVYIVIHNIDDIYILYGQNKGEKYRSQLATLLKNNLSNLISFSNVRFNSFVGYQVVSENVDLQKVKIDILKKIRPKNLNIGIDIELEITVGISIYPDNSVKFLRLIDYARESAIKSHSEGSKVKIFTEYDKDDFIKTNILRKDIPRALDENEFFLMFQPQFAIKTGNLIGCEVLIRWNHPKYGLIPPDSFISLAEENQNIVYLGRYVQEETVKQCKEWLSVLPEGFKFAINASLIEVITSDFVDKFVNIISKHGVPSRHFEIEFLESVATEYYTAINGKMLALRKNGISVSIDDFGTGHSSLYRLKSLNFDLIKIDKSLLRGIATDKKVEKLIMIIIKLAEIYDTPVLAEGIEDQKELDILRKIGCTYGQGFYLSKPIDKLQMLEMIVKFFDSAKKNE